MRINYLKSLLLALAATAMVACIQDEELNVEAAIDDCTVQGMTAQADIDTNQKIVRVNVSKNLSFASVRIDFVLPDGATIKATETLPADRPDDSIYDFSADSDDDEGSRQFTVTSEDGSQQATYTVRLTRTSQIVTSYSFEQIEMHTTSAGKEDYQIFVEANGMRWSSGNAGFALTGMAKTPTDYPTLQASEGQSGKCARLITRDTGSFGAMVGMYIASGNLFMGSFSVGNALANPLKATKFGQVFYRNPLKLRGYYRYRAGEVFEEKGVANAARKDYFDIYAIFYETTSDDFMLDGTNKFTSPQLVKKARINEAEATESKEWREFEIDFETVDGKTVDSAKLEAGKYKLGIVFASSVEGDLFNGAVGSTLDIDEVELICE